MSYLYTLENCIRRESQNNLMDIINPLLNISQTAYMYPYIVKEEEAMRIDLICMSIYGNTRFIDELLTMNNILNPWSIRVNDVIYFMDEDDILSAQLKPIADENKLIQSLVNPNKDTKKDPNRETGENLPPTIRPTGLKDVTIDFNNKTIKIIDKLQ